MARWCACVRNSASIHRCTKLMRRRQSKGHNSSAPGVRYSTSLRVCATQHVHKSSTHHCMYLIRRRHAKGHTSSALGSGNRAPSTTMHCKYSSACKQE
eukprot:11790-Pelagomonas_calceolata.AAC.1